MTRSTKDRKSPVLRASSSCSTTSISNLELAAVAAAAAAAHLKLLQQPQLLKRREHSRLGSHTLPKKGNTKLFITQWN